MGIKRQLCRICCLFLLSAVWTQNFSSTSSSSSSSANNSGISLSLFGETDLSGDSAGILRLAMSTSDYPATPGDVYQLAYIAGTTPVSTTLMLDANYMLKVHNLGILNARGQTLLALKDQVEKLVSKNYPLSGVQFVLTSPGMFTVLVRGEVNESALVNAYGLSRVSDVLDGKLTSQSSLRDVRLLMPDGKEILCDLYEATRNGDFTKNPYVIPGCTITVGCAERRVSISGTVYRPGNYQLLAGEGIKEIVEKYGGGFTNEADPSRFVIKCLSSETDLQGSTKEGTFEELQSYDLKDGDAVQIFSKKDKMNILEIEGAIDADNSIQVQGTVQVEGAQKITHRFYSGESLSTAVYTYASHIQPSADLENSYVMRGTQVIPIDLQKILYKGDFSADIVLESGDRLIIPFKQYFVVVAGQVKIPGKYPYVPGRYYEYYINLAGGFNDEATSGRRVKLHDLNNNPISRTEPIPPEAVISVPATRLIYFVNRYSSLVTMTVSVSTLGITLYNFFSAR
ncbi:MAG: SLBB domain-containing protein [Bacteroides sp.]|nr:SLBB domain-containing protein [Prevotella sp.]MCM1408662.1 SLBB domain-containing protein [Treponema brennaborense]MCM1470523.1 SLBB domain-containing protein [Bacteroides sp.]